LDKSSATFHTTSLYEVKAFRLKNEPSAKMTHAYLRPS